jgi:serine/threonine-protein kinase
VLGQPADHRVDQYALGCVLFRMIRGGTPFKGPTTADILRAQVRAPIPKLSDEPGALASPLDSILARALAKNPEDRYHSAGAMRDDIDRAIAFLGGRPAGQ